MPAHELDGPIDVRIAQAAAEFAQGLQHPAAKIGRAGVDHGVVIGEGHVAEEVAIIVAVEARPTAVAILHGQHPPQPALDGRDNSLVGWDKLRGTRAVGRGERRPTERRTCRIPFLTTRNRQLTTRQRWAGARRGSLVPPYILGLLFVAKEGLQGHQRHGRVVNVRVELVGIFEIPAAGRGIDRFGPIARRRRLAASQPVGRPHDCRIVGRHARDGQCPHHQARIPNRRKARLQPRRAVAGVIDGQAIQLPQALDDLRAVVGIAQGLEGHGG